MGFKDIKFASVVQLNDSTELYLVGSNEPFDGGLTESLIRV